MDGLAFHPYPDNSSQSPDFPHPRSTSIGLADYGKLVGLLGTAFDGTAQPGSSLPILYDEFGIESAIPDGKASLYTGTEPTTTKPVDEYQQAASYDLGLRLAFCQPTVAGVLLFHSQDESALLSWQSGVYYADGTPKASLPGRARLARPDARRLDHPLRRARARRRPDERPLPRAEGVRERQARHALPLHARLRLGARRRRARPPARSRPPFAVTRASGARPSPR